MLLQGYSLHNYPCELVGIAGDGEWFADSADQRIGQATGQHADLAIARPWKTGAERSAPILRANSALQVAYREGAQIANGAPRT